MFGVALSLDSNLAFVLIRFTDAGDVPSQKEISHVLVHLLLQGTLKTILRHLPHACKESNQRIEHSLTVAQRKENPPSTNTPCLTSNVRRKLASSTNSTELAVRVPSPSFSHHIPFLFLSQPVHGKRKAFLAMTKGLLQVPFNSWHSMSRTM